MEEEFLNEIVEAIKLRQRASLSKKRAALHSFAWLMMCGLSPESLTAQEEFSHI